MKQISLPPHRRFVLTSGLLALLGGSVMMAALPSVASIGQKPAYFYFVMIPAGILTVLAVGATGYMVIRDERRFSNEVWETVDALIVRKWGGAARIPLTDIKSMGEGFSTTGIRYTILTLHRPCRFGNEVSFIPIGARGGTLSHTFPSPLVIQNLIQHIDQAHGHPARAIGKPDGFLLWWFTDGAQLGEAVDLQQGTKELLDAE